MSADRDVTRIVRSWLHEDAHEDADRVLDMVLDLVDMTPQRRASWLARRTPTMNNYARLGLVAAAVLAVVIVGIGLFGRSPDVGPTTSPTPSSASASNPLVGTWVAPEVTCAQQVAVIEAAGYTAEQITQARAQLVQDLEGFGASHGPEAFFDPTCENIAYEPRWAPVRDTDQWSLVFDGLPLAATIRSAREIDHDLEPSPHNYRLVDDSTFEYGSHNGKVWEYCLTLRYSIVGDQLTIERIAPSCTGTADASLLDQIAETAILETSSFTRQP